MPRGVGYTVDFDTAAAWSLVNEDEQGRFIFVFEPGDTPKKVSLSRIPLENHRVVQVKGDKMRMRVDQAFERTRAFLVSCGYEVDPA